MTCMGEKLTNEEVNDMFQEAGVKEGGYIYFERKLPNPSGWVRNNLALTNFESEKKDHCYAVLGSIKRKLTE